MKSNKKPNIMKNLKKIILMVISILLLGTLNSFSQKGGRGHGHGNGGHGGGKGYRHGGKVMVKKSIYRPGKIVVYHPFWGPKRAFNHRWVYFPRHNFYWDNWRNQYVFWNGTIWYSQPSPPPAVININIDNEKHYELNDKDDDVDDVYQGNETHKTEYKPD